MAAPAASAFILPKAVSRSRYFRPQSGAGMILSGMNGVKRLAGMNGVKRLGSYFRAAGSRAKARSEELTSAKLGEVCNFAAHALAILRAVQPLAAKRDRGTHASRRCQL